MAAQRQNALTSRHIHLTISISRELQRLPLTIQQLNVQVIKRRHRAQIDALGVVMAVAEVLELSTV